VVNISLKCDAKRVWRDLSSKKSRNDMYDSKYLSKYQERKTDRKSSKETYGGTERSYLHYIIWENSIVDPEAWEFVHYHRIIKCNGRGFETKYVSNNSIQGLTTLTTLSLPCQLCRTLSGIIHWSVRPALISVPINDINVGNVVRFDLFCCRSEEVDNASHEISK